MADQPLPNESPEAAEAREERAAWRWAKKHASSLGIAFTFSSGVLGVTYMKTAPPPPPSVAVPAVAGQTDQQVLIKLAVIETKMDEMQRRVDRLEYKTAKLPGGNSLAESSPLRRSRGN
jgi:hypothetical protein